MTLPIILLMALAIATALLFSILRVTHGGMVSLMTKTLASFCFVLLGVVVVFHKPILDVAMFVILGLVCGMIGDILLDLKSVDHTRADAYLNFGMLAFGIGHVFYVLFVALLSGKKRAYRGIDRRRVCSCVHLGGGVLFQTTTWAYTWQVCHPSR